ncbi:peptidoglycan-recognition protein SC1a-like [Acanthaster planci]|uniref:Peptidoglycan-recognition protein SC1a-like n=1 Tax=Acanthaster planci TaxID=133434 RepID=A0A8B7YY68_ACAPL|nr:peptidoglycan-recognition protein SC1a-like [Acanthaster planci]
MGLQSHLSVTVLLCLCVANTTFSLRGFLHPTDDPCSSLPVTYRRDWQARSPLDSVDMTGHKHVVLVHQTRTSSCNAVLRCEEVMQNIQNYHMDTKGWNDIGYNFAIGGDGSVYEGRGWKTAVPQTDEASYDPHVAIIAFIGTYVNNLPSERMYDRFEQLLLCGMRRGQLIENVLVCFRFASETVGWKNDIGNCTTMSKTDIL